MDKLMYKEYQKLLGLTTDELVFRANKVRKAHIRSKIELCGIVNAKSGVCGEDCKFCAQSAKYCTNVPIYPLMTKAEILEEAKKAYDNGAERFGIVTSGNRLTKDEIEGVSGTITAISKNTEINVCASLGALSEEDFLALKEAGLIRYHHNIETSERYYSSIVSTHDYDERINTIKVAKNAGLEVCSGGILGMGETWQDRIDMAVLLKELNVSSVPLNFLIPIKGTPMENVKPISPIDAIRSIALFRIILEDVIIKVVAGRESVLRDFQGMMYLAGANGMMVGGYLTVKGGSPCDDKELLKEIRKLWNVE